MSFIDGSTDRRIDGSTSAAAGAERALSGSAAQSVKPQSVEPVNDHVPAHLSVVRREPLKHRVHLRSDCVTVLHDENLRLGVCEPVQLVAVLPERLMVIGRQKAGPFSRNAAV